MADTKISALTAAASAADANEFPINEAGTSKKVTLAQMETQISASPTLTGTPAAPTAAVDTNTTQIATTAFVLAQSATQAQQEAGTVTVNFVSPGRQHFHPSAAKCWVSSTQSSTTIQASYNVASVADTGAGISTVTIANDFSGTTYCVVVGAEHNSASATTQTYNIDNSGRAAGTYIIQSWQVDGTEALTDPSASWFSVAFGDL